MSIAQLVMFLMDLIYALSIARFELSTQHGCLYFSRFILGFNDRHSFNGAICSSIINLKIYRLSISEMLVGVGLRAYIHRVSVRQRLRLFVLYFFKK
jgi:hypothetical protein